MSSPAPNSSGPQKSDDVATETGVQVELPAVGAATAADESRPAARPAAGSTAGSVLAVDDTEGDGRKASADAESSFAGMRRREMSVTEQARRTLGDGGSSEHKSELASIATDGSKASPRDRSAMIVGVMLVFSSVAIDMLGLSIILPVLPFYALKFDASSFEVGIVFSAYALAQTISVPIAGKLSDRFGRRTMILWSLAGSCGGFLFQALSNSLVMFLCARFAAGIVGASVPIAMAFVCDVTTKEERPKFMAFLGSIIGAAFLLGPGIGSGLAEFSLTTPMFVGSCLAFTGFVVSYFKLQDPSDFMPHAPKAAPGADNTVAGTDLNAEEAELSASYTFLICCAEFLNMAAFVAVLTMLGLYMADVFGFDTLQLGFLLSGQSVVYVMTQLLLFPRLVQKVGKHGAAVCGCVVFSAGFALIPLGDDVFGIVAVGLALGGVGFGCIAPALPSLMSRYNTKANQGRAMGLGQSMQSLARVIVPGVYGLLFDVNMKTPFWVASGLCLLNAVLIFAVLQRSKRTHRRQMSKGLVDSARDIERSMTPKVLSEARLIDKERVQLLGQLTAELLVKAGYTAEQLNSEGGLGIALNFLELSLDPSFADTLTGGEVGEALRAAANVRS